LLISGSRNKIDNKYYVPAFITPPFGHGFKIDLLVDTGSSRTQLTANHILYFAGILPNTLPEGETYKGIEGSEVKSYILKGTTLRFLTDIGPYDVIMPLSISSTIDIFLPGILGMDILREFDIILDGPFGVILRKRFDIFK
jgi:hypothetical protein